MKAIVITLLTLGAISELCLLSGAIRLGRFHTVLSPESLSSRFKKTPLLIIRGGSRYDDEYDEYDRPSKRRPPPNRRQPPPSSRRPPPPSSRRQLSPGRDRRPPSSKINRRNNRRSPPPSVLDKAASVAKKTVDLTSAAAWGTLKGSGKAAFYLVSPKHVTRQEVWGVWRLDQSVDTEAVCAANVELTPRGDVLVKFEDKEFGTPFLFRERKWPQSCTIEFEARAFQGPNDKAPVLMRYKGYFRRKLADKNVVKIVGHIYAVRKKGWRRGDGKRIGTFVARRRLTKKRTVVDEDEYDDWDDDDEYAFEEDFDDDEEEDRRHDDFHEEYDDFEDDDEYDDEY